MSLYYEKYMNVNANHESEGPEEETAEEHSKLPVKQEPGNGV